MDSPRHPPQRSLTTPPGCCPGTPGMYLAEMIELMETMIIDVLASDARKTWTLTATTYTVHACGRLVVALDDGSERTLAVGEAIERSTPSRLSERLLGLPSSLALGVTAGIKVRTWIHFLDVKF